MWVFLLILGLFFAIGVPIIAKVVLKNTMGDISTSSRYGERFTPEQIAEAKQKAADTINGYLSKIKLASYTLATLLVLWGLASTSYYRVPTRHTGHRIKVYSFGSESNLKGSDVIATKGEMGRQADLLPEGLNFGFLMNVMYDVQDIKNIVIPPGQVGLLKAIDGVTLPQNMYIAPDWVPDSSEDMRSEIEANMLDANYFLTNAGHAGPQLNVLTPNEYKINQYLWTVKTVPATTIQPGFVGVVFSQVGQVPEDIEMATEGGNLAQPLVEKGYKGVWREPLTSGMYYLNTDAYQITPFDTRIQTWVYAGGYTKKTIDLKYDEKGEIVQVASEEKIPMPPTAAGTAIDVKSKDAWIINNEARVQIQVEPLNAPRIFASVGTLEQLEDRVITPILRSDFRNQGEKVDALKFLNARSTIEAETEKTLRLEGQKAGVSIKGFKLAEVVIPPELLVPAKRTQLANQMKATYKEEQKAYKERQASENAKALADQQPKLVAAEIAKQSASLNKDARKLEGEGEKLYLMQKGEGEKTYMTQVAEGQKAQVEVYGLEKSLELQRLDMTLGAAEKSPGILQTPLIYVNGGNGSAGGLGDNGVLALTYTLKALESGTLDDKQVNKLRNAVAPKSTAQVVKK
jgi:hypothetical protein